MWSKAAQMAVAWGDRALALALVVALAAPPGANPARAQSSFTNAEQARLARGELVVRRESQMRGQLRLVGGTAWQVVNAPAEAVWKAVLDTPYYTRLLPQVSEARNVTDRDGSRLVFIRHGSGPVQASYHVRIDYRSSQRMAQFRLDRTRPHAIREAYGFFIVRPYGGGRTLINFGIMADVGTGIVVGALRPEVHSWMLRVPQTIKWHVEGSGRQRYLAAARGG